MALPPLAHSLSGALLGSLVTLASSAICKGHKSHWLWVLRVEDREKAAKKVRDVLTKETLWLKGPLARGSFAQLRRQARCKLLQKPKVPTLEWHWPTLDAFNMGKAIFIMELMVAGLGESLGLKHF
jgi:hypothetical protein